MTFPSDGDQGRESSKARVISIDLRKTILVVPELTRFSHSQGQLRRFDHALGTSARPQEPDLFCIDPLVTATPSRA